MNADPQTVDRIPLAHSIRYVARGLPEVPNQYGPGVLAPSEITLTYRAAPDSGLGRVHAYVAGRIWVDGTELPLLPSGLYGQHYDDGLGGWPEWLAEEARLHEPAAAGVVSAAPDQADVERVAEALHAQMPGCTHDEHGNDCGGLADAVLSVLPPPADRAAVLREAADRLDAAPPPTDHPDRFLSGVRWATSALRRIARETQQTTVSGPGAADDKQDGARP